MASCGFPTGLASAECPDVDPGSVSVCVSLIHLLCRPVAVCHLVLMMTTITTMTPTMVMLRTMIWILLLTVCQSARLLSTNAVWGLSMSLLHMSSSWSFNMFFQLPHYEDDCGGDKILLIMLSLSLNNGKDDDDTDEDIRSMLAHFGNPLVIQR